MRDAFIITIILIALFLLLGYMYNAMAPYLVKLGILESIFTPATRDAGLFYSNDFGRSWNQLKDKGEDITKNEIFDIQFDKNAPNALTIAASEGLYRSENLGGDLYYITSGVLRAGESVNSFAVDPKSSQRMYVASYTKDKGGRILKSKESGFYEVYSTILRDDNVLGVWIDSYDTSTVYAGTQKGLFLKSQDFGESWQVAHEFSGPVRALFMLPSDTRIMYIVVSGKIFKTVNSGKSWSNITNSLLDRYGGNFAVEQMAIDSRNEDRIYIATTDGLLRSDNAGASFSRIELLTAGEEPQVSAVSLDPTAGGMIYIGVGSQIHISEDSGKTWQIKSLATYRKVNVIRVKPDDPSVIFVGVK